MPLNYFSTRKFHTLNYVYKWQRHNWLLQFVTPSFHHKVENALPRCLAARLGDFCGMCSFGRCHMGIVAEILQVQKTPPCQLRQVQQHDSFRNQESTWGMGTWRKAISRPQPGIPLTRPRRIDQLWHLSPCHQRSCAQADRVCLYTEQSRCVPFCVTKKWLQEITRADSFFPVH